MKLLKLNKNIHVFKNIFSNVSNKIFINFKSFVHKIAHW